MELQTKQRRTRITKSSVARGKKPASIVAQEKLLEMFQNGAFKGGDSLKETVLTVQLGVTRPAMREALNQAVGWGIVEYEPYCGYKIRDFSIYDMLECYEMREALEPIAAWRLAQMRPPKVLAMLEEYFIKFKKVYEAGDVEQAAIYDSKFHLGVIEHCGNKSFARMQNVSNLAATFYSNSQFVNEYKHLVPDEKALMLGENFTDEEYNKLGIKLTIEKHQKMLHSLKSGDMNQAEKLFREHAHTQVENLRNIIVFQRHQA